MKILQEACSPEAALDKSLPYNAYLVEYKVDGNITFDITTSSKQVEMFDYYYDKYKKDFIGWKQAEGRVNPKIWGGQSKPAKEKSK